MTRLKDVQDFLRRGIELAPFRPETLCPCCDFEIIDEEQPSGKMGVRFRGSGCNHPYHLDCMVQRFSQGRCGAGPRCCLYCWETYFDRIPRRRRDVSDAWDLRDQIVAHVRNGQGAQLRPTRTAPVTRPAHTTDPLGVHDSAAQRDPRRRAPSPRLPDLLSREDMRRETNLPDADLGVGSLDSDVRRHGLPARDLALDSAEDVDSNAEASPQENTERDALWTNAAASDSTAVPPRLPSRRASPFNWADEQDSSDSSWRGRTMPSFTRHDGSQPTGPTVDPDSSSSDSSDSSESSGSPAIRARLQKRCGSMRLSLSAAKVKTNQVLDENRAMIESNGDPDDMKRLEMGVRDINRVLYRISDADLRSRLKRVRLTLQDARRSKQAIKTGMDRVDAQARLALQFLSHVDLDHLLDVFDVTVRDPIRDSSSSSDDSPPRRRPRDSSSSSDDSPPRRRPRDSSSSSDDSLLQRIRLRIQERASRQGTAPTKKKVTKSALPRPQEPPAATAETEGSSDAHSQHGNVNMSGRHGRRGGASGGASAGHTRR
ncbi:hypothetical protein HBH69_062150 [Parastagonospora nodorum]|nr:hypothetical protein HBI06_038940 [Parastagonospora nodorum]KAH4239060.1 hypothetical protein HBI05_121920 [Parastagonospora nodorum]KAH5158419.1 hypothetical protein HBH69_062150 [Parastagonospora nodorum]KAH5514361.1 hypothetical protein HBI52_118330 [Parastagonospora nodorum]